MKDTSNDLFRSLPPVERLLEDPRVTPWHPVLSRPLVARVIADTLAALREEMRGTGTPVTEPEVLARLEAEIHRFASRRIRKVINATGIILHTNMGRSPIPAAAWEAAAPISTGYANVELDLDTGKRGRRNGLCPDLLRVLTGCEDALVVNNNAAAVLLVLTALAAGKDVIVSRGEQVQIGGGFRIPEILALSGARLVEVGTTNITTLADYTNAVTERTAMVLVVHTSNFRIRGFTEKPQLAALAAALPPQVFLVVDQGSGAVVDTVPGETRVSTLLKQGAHLACFSGDKILGGPQAGIIAGKAPLVGALAAHPLMRAFRPGKTIASLLEQCLIGKLNGGSPGRAEEVLAVTREELERLGRRLLKGIPPEAARIVDAAISTGGGSAPDEFVPSLAIEITAAGAPEGMLRRFRALPTPVIGVIEQDRVRLFLATMHGEDEDLIAGALRSVLGA